MRGHAAQAVVRSLEEYNRLAAGEGVQVMRITFQEIAAQSPEDALHRLSSSAREGLSTDQASERLAEYGVNEVSGTETAAFTILLRQFKSSFIYLLFAASAIALYLGEYLDAGLIFLFLVINAALGFVQEYRAEHARSLDTSLEVIVDGIREGRKIFANTMKYLRATLTSNVGNFYALALAALFILYLPMLPVQVLLLNLLTDFPMISIAADSVDDAELERPRGYQVGELTAVAIVLGAISTLFDFAFFAYFVRFGDPALLQTMWFLGSVLTELVLLFSIRTALPFWRSKPPSATVLWLTLSVMGATVALPFVAPLRELFGFIVPRPDHLAMVFVLVGLYFASTETAKLLFYHHWHHWSAAEPQPSER